MSVPKKKFFNITKDILGIMIKVDILRASWLSNPVGPSRTLNRIIKNKDYYNERGYDIEIFTLDRIINRDIQSFRNASKSLKYKVKSIVKRISKNSVFFCSKILERETFFYGKQLIEYYLSLNRDADIIVFHDFFSCYYYNLYASKNKKVKTVLFYHNNGAAFDALLYYYPKIRGSKYLNTLLDREKFVIEKTDMLVFIAEYGRKNFLSIYPMIDDKKTITIHNGIDDIYISKLDSNPCSKKEFRLVCSGTINQRKGQHLIIQALLELKKELLNRIHITFIGDGPMKKELEAIVSKNNLQNNVSFLGVVQNSDIYKYLALSNIYILMSYEEGLPISIIEGMRSGLGIIATRIAGIPELVQENYNGILLSPNKDQLKEVFCDLPNHDWVKYGLNSRKLFEQKYTFNNMLTSYCDMLDSLR